MNKKILLPAFVIAALSVINPASAQFKLNTKTMSAAEKGFKSVTFSDADAAKLAKEAVTWMDANNPVAAENDPYSIRLRKIFAKHQHEGGLDLNFKVYKVKDINAFACADGSVRVFSSLMDIMTDEELLGVIGHEIGHVVNKDSKDAVRAVYKREALTDAASSQSGAVNAISQSQLGSFAGALLDSRYSRKQESQADDYSYDFLKRNNYKVTALASAFTKLADLEKSSGSTRTKSEKMLSSHPDSAERAAKVMTKAKKDGLAA
ncbi:M48 family metallopeptidase [Mucilaginibacter sp.]